LYAQLSAQRAHQLRLRLESLGAQIRVVPFSAPSLPTIDPPAPPFAPALRTAALALLAILLGFTALVVFTALALHRNYFSKQNGPEARLGMPFTTAALQPIEPPRQPAAQPRADAEALQLNAAAVEMAQRGELEGAAERLHQALRLVPDQLVLRQNLQAVLLSAGQRALDAGHPAEALNSLREALALGERSDVRQAMGVARLQAGEFGEARADLERAVAGGTKDATTWLALGEAYLHENDRTHALECLQHARDAGAHGPQLDALVERLGREIDAEWDFAALESPHFRASFAEGENRRAAQFVLEGLEDARRAVGA
jgi:tetratricopeptide (TPR) repeat protein